jgi:hypothetical protein
VRQPIPAAPGQLERYDCEYRRNGTVNLFVCIDIHRPWRNVKVTERRAAEDYAQCMRELVDVHYPDAECIRVVQDNLSIHSAGALYQAFTPAEARRILRRLEFHYTPKHASWLNMVEIEIGVLRGRCLERRIDDPNRLVTEIGAWEAQRRMRTHQMDVHNRKKPAPKWAAHIPTRPKSHNHCDQVLVETCKPNDVDPLAYLTDVLTRIVNGHPNSEIDQLLPWAYRRQDLKAVA